MSRDGVVGRHAGVLEDYGCVADGFLALLSATGDASWLEAAGRLLDTALAGFAADDGGFFDTAADAETLVTRPRDPSDNASPSGQSALVHALLGYAAVTGSGRHRDAAEAALRNVRTLAERVAAVRRVVAGRCRGRPGRTARGGGRGRGRGPGPGGARAGRPGGEQPRAAVLVGADAGWPRRGSRCSPVAGSSRGGPPPTCAGGWSATGR